MSLMQAASLVDSAFAVQREITARDNVISALQSDLAGLVSECRAQAEVIVRQSVIMGALQRRLDRAALQACLLDSSACVSLREDLMRS